MKRGDVFYADLGKRVGSEQGGVRPVLIIQNDLGNQHSPTIIGVPITSKMGKSRIPTHVLLNSSELPRWSILLFEQIVTLDKHRLGDKITHIPPEKWEKALKVSVGL